MARIVPCLSSSTQVWIVAHLGCQAKCQTQNAGPTDSGTAFTTIMSHSPNFAACRCGGAHCSIYNSAPPGLNYTIEGRKMPNMPAKTSPAHSSSPGVRASVFDCFVSACAQQLSMSPIVREKPAKANMIHSSMPYGCVCVCPFFGHPHPPNIAVPLLVSL